MGATMKKDCMKPDDIKFCRIDAKDDYFCGYSPIAFTIKDQRVETLGKQNSLLAVQMEYEYLFKLWQLQKTIRTKYLKLTKDEPINGRDWWHSLTKKEFEDAKLAIKKKFPKNIDMENLDNLYYT